MIMLSTNESYLVEVDDPDEVLEIQQRMKFSQIFEKEVPTWISMHTFEGQMNFSTLKLEGLIKSQVITILLDSCSTHNFMQLEVFLLDWIFMLQDPSR